MAISILLAEDEHEIREVLSDLLCDEGYAVEIAIHGQEALTKQLTSPADLIISDIMMPVMGGLEFVSALRANGDATPIIFVSAQLSEIPPHLNAYLIVKPFDIDHVLSVVHHVIEQCVGNNQPETNKRYKVVQPTSPLRLSEKVAPRH